MVGEGFAWVVTTFAGTIGAHILTVFLFIAGRAAADRRVGRGRDQGHDGLGLLDHARAARRGAEAAPARASDDLETLERSPRVRVERPEVFGETPEFETPKPKRAAKKKPAEGRGRELLVGRRALPGPLRRRARSRAEPEPVVEDPSPSMSRSSSGSPRTRSRTRRASRAGRPSRSSPSSSRRRAATAARSPTRPTSSGSSRTPPSSRARPRRPRGRTRPARRRSPRS